MIRPQAYYIYENGPLEELADTILLKAPPLDTATTQSDDLVNQRASQTSFITPNHELGQEIFSTLWSYLADANAGAGWDFFVTGCEPLQFTKYDVGEKYDWHIDTIWNQEDTRKISFSLLLNDDFEGGDLQFEIGSPGTEERITTVKMKKGDIVFFPSYLWHRVTPVTRGERYSLVGWVRGPNFT